MMGIESYISQDWRVSLILFLTFVVLFLIYTGPRLNYWKERKFPEVSITALPVFGHTFKLLIGQKSFSDTFAELYAASGKNPFAGFFHGKHPCLLVKDPDLIRDILAEDFPVFVDRAFQVDRGADPLEAKQLFHLQGREWKEMRKILKLAFSSGRMEVMFSLTKTCTDKMLECLRKETDEGEGLVEIKLSNIAPGLLSKLPLRFTLNGPSDFFRNLVRESIEEREHALKDEQQQGMRTGTGEKISVDFIDALVTLKNAKDTFSLGYLNHDVLTAQAMLFFSAGLETTSSLLSLALFELSSSKEGMEIQQKLREEIDNIMRNDGGRITCESLRQIDLLDRVLSETLRLYPPAGVLSRKCKSRYSLLAPGTLGNLSLEKGSRIFIPVQALHNDPKYFPDPGRFDPDRFLPKNMARRPNYVYLPFGGGPRMCIGFRLAFMQAQLGLSSLLSKYEFELHPIKSKVPIEFSPHSFILTPKRGIWLKVRQRRKKFRRNACTHKDLEQEFGKLQGK